MRKLSAEAHAFLNDESMIAERDMWFDRMQAIYDGKKDDFNSHKVFTLHGCCPQPPGDYLYTEPEKWTMDCLELLPSRKGTKPDGFTPICFEHSPYGVHYIDKILGANVYFRAGQWNADYLTTPIGSLEMPDLDKNETWQLSKRAAMTFLEADVTFPLFGTPILSSALNILVNLYGQEALIAMYDDEDAVHHDLDVINTLIRTLHRWYVTHIPQPQLQAVFSFGRTQPPGFGQLCGCTTQLLGKDLYRKFAADLDNAVLGEHPHGGMIHLCGEHTQHMETFRNMKNLRAVQLNHRAAEDLALYLEGLREDQVIFVNPCSAMPIEKIIDITKGERLILITEDPPYDKPGKAKA